MPAGRPYAEADHGFFMPVAKRLKPAYRGRGHQFSFKLAISRRHPGLKVVRVSNVGIIVEYNETWKALKLKQKKLALNKWV